MPDTSSPSLTEKVTSDESLIVTELEAKTETHSNGMLITNNL